MAQTTDALSAIDCLIEIGDDGATWTDISGFANSIEVEGGDRQSGEVHTFDGFTPILTLGKGSLYEITCKIVYTEGATDPTEVIRAAYEGGTEFYIQWTPKGGAAGDFVYTSGAGYILSHTYPSADAGSPDAIGIEFVVTVPNITKSVAT